MTDNLSYGPMKPDEIPMIEAMIQGTDFQGLSFRAFSQSIYVARQYHRVIGVTVGRRQQQENFHFLDIQGVYLVSRYNDPAHEVELKLEFINWAKERYGLTHYKLNSLDTLKPICTMAMMTPQIPLNIRDTEEFPPAVLPVYTI